MFFICSPTTAIMDRSLSVVTWKSYPPAASAANSSRMARTARSVSSGWMANVMENSDEAWVIRMTLTDTRARASNRRLDEPDTPTMAGLWTVTIVTFGMEDTPLMRAVSLLLASRPIHVPSASGLKVFRIWMGICAR